MSKYLNEYLGTRDQRARAETSARRWRLAALVLLLLLVGQTWLAIDTAIVLRDTENAATKLLQDQESEIYAALQQKVDAIEAREVAEKRFGVCKAANAGLYEALQEQQSKLERCDSSSTTFAGVPP